MITAAYTAEQFAAIERLARRIVPDFYSTFFGRATGEYLVESGHTAVALAIQADRGYRHYLIEDDGKPVGYFSLGPAAAGSAVSRGGKTREGSVLLSHFYVLPEFRGKGLGHLAMKHIDAQVVEMGARRIELFVLRENSAAVELYRKNGFVVAKEVLTRLGNGAILEDYLMCKEVEN